MGKSKTIQTSQEVFKPSLCQNCHYTKGKDPDLICNNELARAYNSRIFFNQNACMLFKEKK